MFCLPCVGCQSCAMCPWPCWGSSTRCPRSSCASSPKTRSCSPTSPPGCRARFRPTCTPPLTLWTPLLPAICLSFLDLERATTSDHKVPDHECRKHNSSPPPPLCIPIRQLGSWASPSGKVAMTWWSESQTLGE